MRILLANGWYTPGGFLLDPGVREVDDSWLEFLPPTATDADTGEVLNPVNKADRKAGTKAPVDASNVDSVKDKPEEKKASEGEDKAKAAAAADAKAKSSTL